MRNLCLQTFKDQGDSVKTVLTSTTTSDTKIVDKRVEEVQNYMRDPLGRTRNKR